MWRKPIQNAVMNVIKVLETIVDDLHYGNFATFGDTILCIDFAGYDH